MRFEVTDVVLLSCLVVTIFCVAGLMWWQEVSRERDDAFCDGELGVDRAYVFDGVECCYWSVVVSYGNPQSKQVCVGVKE